MHIAHLSQMFLNARISTLMHAHMCSEHTDPIAGFENESLFNSHKKSPYSC